jgi:sorting and assembly machinery component 37
MAFTDGMIMQLYILGPAFGLPSIDAECNAAVALLQLRVPESYTIIPTHHNPTRLPYLVDGASRIWGFNNIARHLIDKRISPERSTLSAIQQADTIAATAFLETNANLLLDVSFYVSFENYRNATRPAFTRLLPWHTNYILPPQRRAAARARTAHLGIATTIDVDDVHGDLSDRPAGAETGGTSSGKETAFAEATQQRASLLLPKKDTLKGLLKKPEHAAVFKLNALADDVLAPLQDLLGGEGKDREECFLLDASEPHALDCLALGYLSLMLYPTLPHSWLADRLRARYPRLVAYTERLRQRLHLHAPAEEITALHQSGPSTIPTTSSSGLPFRAPESPTSIAQRLQEISSAILDSLPAPLHQFFPGSSTSTLHLQHAPAPPRSTLLGSFLHPTILLTVITAASLAVTLCFRRGVLVWPSGAPAQIFLSRRAVRLPEFLDLGFLGAQIGGGAIGGFGR